MSLKNRVLALLRGREAARINFTVPSASVPVTINQATFTTVANAIVEEKIGIKPVAAADGVFAAYAEPAGPTDPPSGQLELPPILGRFEEAAVMHESVHAFFDLTMSDIKATEEEAVCYIVSALYYRMTGLTPRRWAMEPHKSAKPAADALLRQYAAGVRRVPAVDAGVFRRLNAAVMLQPGYLGGPAGLFPWVFSQPDRYENNG